jgi:hypothetical protein
MVAPDEHLPAQEVGAADPAKATSGGLIEGGFEGVLKHLMEEHGGVFALIKRLGMRSDEQLRRELEPRVRIELMSGELGEMAALYLALKEIVQSELSLESDGDPSELANAVAALGAINPGSPEWGPAFLHVSELVEAHVIEESRELFPKADERRHVFRAC